MMIEKERKNERKKEKDGNTLGEKEIKGDDNCERKDEKKKEGNR